MAILNKDFLIGTGIAGVMILGFGLYDSYNDYQMDELRLENELLQQQIENYQSSRGPGGSGSYQAPTDISYFMTQSRPTDEYPFDGLEGWTYVVQVAENGTVWQEVTDIVDDRLVFERSEQREQMISNLVIELDEQTEQDLSQVRPGDMFELDLQYVPSRNGTPVPFGASAPLGAVEAPPLTAESNPDFGMPFTEDPFEWATEEELEIIEAPEQISDGSVTYDPSEMTSPVEVAECDTPFPLEGDPTEYKFGECYLTELPR